MKINNDFIVFDLECTSNQETKEERPEFQTNWDIIDIGAVHVNKCLSLGDSFSSLVKSTERITPFIEELTGISNEMILAEKNWLQVGSLFYDWAKDIIRNTNNIRLAAWGNYFDMPILRRSYEERGVKFPFSGTCVDIKSLAFMWCALSGKRTDKLSVERVASYMNINPEGQYHRAIVDAKVEAAILIRIMKDLSEGHFMELDNKYEYISIKKIELYRD